MINEEDKIMTNNIEKLLLEHLKRIQVELSEARERDKEIISRLGHLEHSYATLTESYASLAGSYASQNGRIDRISDRLDRIERRLELTDSPA